MEKLELIERIKNNLKNIEEYWEWFEDYRIFYNKNGLSCHKRDISGDSYSINIEDIDIKILQLIYKDINNKVEIYNTKSSRYLTVGKLIKHLQNFNPNSLIEVRNPIVIFSAYKF